MFAATRAGVIVSKAETVIRTYAKWDTARKSASILLTDAALTATKFTTDSSGVLATVSKSTGKWYWEIKVLNAASGASVGTYPNTTAYLVALPGYPDAGSGFGWLSTGGIYREGSLVQTVAAYAANDVLGFAFDADAQTLAIYKNGVYQATISSITSGSYPGFGRDGSVTANFGASPFTYSVPSGFNSGLFV